MATEEEQTAMDHFSQAARDDPEHQALLRRMREQAEMDKRRFNERCDGAVKASRLLEKLRNQTQE